MAIAATAVETNGEFRKTYDISADEADTGPTAFNHGIPNLTTPNTELLITIEPLLPAAYVAQWSITGRSTTQITLSKSNAEGSNGTSIRIHVSRVHSIVD